ncbi:MAG: hypothetical protein ACPGUD_03055 [Parashewanella sp.]
MNKMIRTLSNSAGIAALCFTSALALAGSLPTSNAIVYHNTFPFNTEQKVDVFELNTPFAQNVIMANLVAGSMYRYLVHTQYPQIQVNSDYLVWSLLGQLLQESGLSANQINQQFDATAAKQAIHNPTYSSILLSVGQGGPYQINDYSKKLPFASDVSSLGLANYDAVRKGLGYSIADQDNGLQTSKRGPAGLDDIYFGSMVTAFYHFNDVNRIKVDASNSWYQNAELWNQCQKQMQTNGISEDSAASRSTDFVMNVLYNAGDYSPVFNAYLSVCASQDPSQLARMNDYSLSPQDYRDAIGSPDTSGDTYYRYPRQVSFYADQLFGNDLSQYGLSVNNHVVIKMKALMSVFEKSMQQLSYQSPKGDALNYISQAQAADAFTAAMKSENLTQDSVLSLSNQQDRNELYDLLNNAFDGLSTSVGFKFNAVSHKNV